MQIITRQEAKEKGLGCYFTGKPCRRGHVDKRRTSNGTCYECQKENGNSPSRKKYKAQWHQENKQRLKKIRDKRYQEKKNEILQKQNAYYHRNKDWILKQQAEYYYSRRDEILKERRAKYAALPQCERDKIYKKSREWKVANHERVALTKREWAKKNQERLKPIYAAHSRTRQSKKRMACPSWVDKNQIEEIYLRRQEISNDTGVEYHVDHYYPLRGKTICGLHVPWNLQIITAEENAAKGNKMPEEFYGPNHTMIQMPALPM